MRPIGRFAEWVREAKAHGVCIIGMVGPAGMRSDDVATLNDFFHETLGSDRLRNLPIGFLGHGTAVGAPGILAVTAKRNGFKFIGVFPEMALALGLILPEIEEGHPVPAYPGRESSWGDEVSQLVYAVDGTIVWGGGLGTQEIISAQASRNKSHKYTGATIAPIIVIERRETAKFPLTSRLHGNEYGGLGVVFVQTPEQLAEEILRVVEGRRGA